MQKIVQLAIEAVEKGLRCPVKFKGKKDQAMGLQERMIYYKVPGVSIAVVDQGKISFAKGYGVTDYESNQDIDENTLFQACSISKLVTMLGLLLLVENNVIDLDMDISVYLKCWSIPKKTSDKIKFLTLRQLLSHTGGVTVSGVEPYAEGEEIPTLFEFLNGVKPVSKNDAVELALNQGEFHYSGGGTTIVELLIEEITQQPFKNYIQKSIFEPLNMTRSYFVRRLPKEEINFVTNHKENGEAIKGKYHSYPSFSAAGLWTTPTDLVRLGLNIQKSLQGEKSGLLNQHLAKEIITPIIDADIYFVGLGCFIRKDQKTFGHGGSNPGTRCHAHFTSENEKGVVIMTNSDAGSELETELRFSVFDVYNWPLPLSLEKKIIQVSPEVLNTYVGEYWTIINKNTPNEMEVKTCCITTAENQLIFKWQQHKDSDSEWTMFQLALNMTAYPESSYSFFSKQGMTMAFGEDGHFTAAGANHFRKPEYSGKILQG